jgi:coenzyme PQQ synthesis protein D (PqqD)
MSEPSGETAAFRPNAHVLMRKVEDEYVLVDMSRNQIFALNPTGARLWELLNEGRSRAEAVAQLAAEFDASEETIEDEAERFLALLRRERLIEGDERR